MKTIKIIFSCILFLAISIILNHCKSPTEKKEIPPTITTDTLATDSVKTVEVDTVALHKPLTLIINNLASPTAPVLVGVYKRKDKFLYKEGNMKEYKFFPKGNKLTAHITDLSYGEYALTIYQDENSSGKIDKTIIGIPKERYGFSNNVKPKVKAPTYDDCKFHYDSTMNTVTMNLIK